jgi:hypothetical protein
MKKVILFLAITLATLTSCNKEQKTFDLDSEPEVTEIDDSDAFDDETPELETRGGFKITSVTCAGSITQRFADNEVTDLSCYPAKLLTYGVLAVDVPILYEIRGSSLGIGTLDNIKCSVKKKDCALQLLSWTDTLIKVRVREMTDTVKTAIAKFSVTVAGVTKSKGIRCVGAYVEDAGYFGTSMFEVLYILNAMKRHFSASIPVDANYIPAIGDVLYHGNASRHPVTGWAVIVGIGANGKYIVKERNQDCGLGRIKTKRYSYTSGVFSLKTPETFSYDTAFHTLPN